MYTVRIWCYFVEGAMDEVSHNTSRALGTPLLKVSVCFGNIPNVSMGALKHVHLRNGWLYYVDMVTSVATYYNIPRGTIHRICIY